MPLDTTIRRPEGQPPEIQPGVSPNFNFDATEGSKKKEPSMNNNRKTFVLCLLGLLVTFDVLIFAVSVAVLVQIS